MSKLRSVSVVLAVALIPAACGGGAEQQGGGEQAGGEVAASARELAEKERQELRQAYEAEFKKFDLPAIKPRPKIAFDKITVVDTSKYKAEPPIDVAHASQGPTNSWARLYDASFEYELKNKHKDVLGNFYYADANGSADKQVSDIVDLMSRQPDVLVVTPLGAAVKGPIQQAAAQDIPVVFCADAAPTESFVSLVNRDNYLNGALTAEWLAKRLNYKGKILTESGIAGTDTAETRLQAARDVFKKYPDIKILDHAYTNWSPSEGKKANEALLSKHPELDGIWSDSAFQMIGAIEAFAEAGRPIPPMTAEPLNGFLRLAKKHNVEFFAVGFPPGQAAQCADVAMKVARGEPVPNYVFVDAVAFTHEEVDKWYLPRFSDDVWVDIVQTLPEEKLRELGLQR